jgi:hypothetical protein
MSTKTSNNVVTEINKDQLANLLFNVQGVTFVGADTTTIPDMNIGGRQHLNYMHGNVVKDSIVSCMLGSDYEKRQNTVASKKWVEETIAAALDAGIPPEIVKNSVASLKEYSTQSLEKFEAKERKWGTHMINPDTGKVSRIMVHHTKLDKVTKQPIPETYARYMQVEIMGAKSPVYRYKDTGEVLSEKDLETVKLYLKPRKDEPVCIRDYSIENVKNIRINGSHYKLVG